MPVHQSRAGRAKMTTHTHAHIYTHTHKHTNARARHFWLVCKNFKYVNWRWAPPLFSSLPPFHFPLPLSLSLFFFCILCSFAPHLHPRTPLRHPARQDPFPSCTTAATSRGAIPFLPPPHDWKASYHPAMTPWKASARLILTRPIHSSLLSSSIHFNSSSTARDIILSTGTMDHIVLQSGGSTPPTRY